MVAGSAAISYPPSWPRQPDTGHPLKCGCKAKETHCRQLLSTQGKGVLLLLRPPAVSQRLQDPVVAILALMEPWVLGGIGLGCETDKICVETVEREKLFLHSHN